ncbi:MAG: NAD-dependent epimerase/dehydratase family protein [Chloroflexi bacterium]|nr:NAD-dependent epimerase/dehydratase family protein [Chloroflexota bacterium]
MRILVTGSTGFIGAALCRALVDQGHHVLAFHRPTSVLRLLEDLPVEHVLGDLTQPETLEAALPGVDVVFHAGALLGGREEPGRMYAVTVEGTRSLLAAAHQAGVRRVVHTSSAAALGVPEELPVPIPIHESHTWNFRPDHYPYGYAKYLAEMEVQRAVAAGLDVVIVNPTQVFGAGDIYRQTSSLVVQVASQRLPAVADGGVNAVHLDDVVAGHLAALKLGARGERYILGGENLTLARLIQLIAEVTGVPAPGVVVPVRLVRSLAAPLSRVQSFINLPVPAQTLRLAGRYFYYDTRKARVELGLGPARPVREAIAEAYGWFRQVGAIP